jgi:hypothetical protein
VGQVRVILNDDGADQFLGRHRTGASTIRKLRTLRRISRDSGPPQMPTERNWSRGASSPQNSLSPVRIHSGPAAKTPRKRANFWDRHGARGRNLCDPRLDGGGRSLSRTRLWTEIPDRQGKCREVVQIPASGEASVSDPAPLDVLAGEFPTFGNREFPTNEQRLP